MSFDREFTGEWLDNAERHLTSAQRLIEDEDFAHSIVAFLAQQASENSLKALLVAYRRKVPRLHDLGELLELCRDLLDSPKSHSQVTDLTDYAVKNRYPPAASEVTEQEAKRAVAIAADLYAAVRERLADDDKLPE